MWYIIPRVHKVGKKTNCGVIFRRAWSQSGGQVQHCNMQPDWTRYYSRESIKDCRFSQWAPVKSAEEAVCIFTNPWEGQQERPEWCINEFLIFLNLFFFFFTLSGLQYHWYVHRVAHARRPPEDFGRKHPREDFLPVWQASGVLQEEKQVLVSVLSHISDCFCYNYPIFFFGFCWPVIVSVIIWTEWKHFSSSKASKKQ